MKFGKVAGYKINEQKSLAFLYTNDEKSEREIKETIPFTFATIRIKYLGINLPKEVKDMYSGNCKTLMKEIKDDTDGEIHHVLAMEEKLEIDYHMIQQYHFWIHIWKEKIHHSKR